MFWNENTIRPRRTFRAEPYVAEQNYQRDYRKDFEENTKNVNSEGRSITKNKLEDYSITFGSTAFCKNVEKAKMKTQKEPKLKHVIHHVENYCGNSSLHGLQYVGDTKLSYGERIFWLVSFLFAVAFATYFILDIYNKYDNNPVIISFNPTTVSLDSIPFPAVTICNLNQAVDNVARNIIAYGLETFFLLVDPIF